MEKKELKERFFERFFYAEDGSRDWDRWRKQDPSVVLEFIQQELGNAEKRGEKRYGISLSEKADKPYIVIDDMKQGGKTIFAGTLEHIQINKLLEEENGKQNAK